MRGVADRRGLKLKLSGQEEKAAHLSKTGEESALLVNVDVRIDHISDHIAVMSHSALQNIHSGRNGMRRQAEFDSGTNTERCTPVAQTPSKQQTLSNTALFTAFCSSRIGVNIVGM